MAYDVVVGWDPNKEDIEGYVLYVDDGISEILYEYVDTYPLEDIDPNNPRARITDLSDDLAYYFVVTAYDKNGNESDFSNEICVINGEPCPQANFKGNPKSGKIPLTVEFTDKSTGNITEWYWDFGDGGSSTLKNPVYTYKQAGSYNVTLEVSGPEHIDFIEKINYIKANDAIFLLNPKGGEIIASGEILTIQWHATPEAESFKLNYSLNKGKDWIEIAKGIVGTTYDWEVPTPTSNEKNCLMKLTAYNASGKKLEADKSDATFTIEVITITSPKDGEILTSGTIHNISWDVYETKKNIFQFLLKYTKNGGKTWKKIKNH